MKIRCTLFKYGGDNISNRGVFRSLSNIQDGDFDKNS